MLNNNLLILLLIILSFSTNCKKGEFNPTADENSQQVVDKYKGPSSTHHNFAQYVYDRTLNKPTAVIKGKTAKFFKTEGQIKLESVTVFYQRFYKDEPKKNEIRPELTQITSNEAIIYEKTKIYEFKGDVIVISKNGVRIETQLLYYDEAKNQVYTKPDEQVFIFNKDGTITRGYFLRSDVGLNQIMLDTQKTVTPDQGFKEGQGRNPSINREQSQSNFQTGRPNTQ